jgi:type I restriction enzyme S subunit
MKKYDSYKDSGIEWIGEIPNHWNISRYRYFYFSNMGVTLLKEDVKEDGIYPVYSATETDVLFGYVDEASVILNEGDIVIPARGNSIGHIKVVTSPSTSTQTTIYSKKISQNIETNFVKYFLQGLREHLFQFDRTAIPQITVNQVKNNPLVIPPPEEQIAIANYLDRKTAEIDELIADKKRLLELYEEEKTAIINELVTGKKVCNGDAWTEPVEVKDSGIEWLGVIPEHWAVKRLKHVLKINSGEGIKSEEIKPDGTYPVYGGNGIVGYTENYNSENTEIIIGRVGAKCGNVRLVSGAKWISDNALVANLISKVDINFLTIQMQNMDLNKMANQNAQPLITGTMVKEKEAIFPPLKEQQSIVNHIETECARIDAKKSKTENLIELLTEYRTALISEVVTGKIKVIE